MSEWRKVKSKYCEACEIGKAQEVHHIIARVDGGNNLEENLIDLCKLCHKYAPNGIAEMEWYVKFGGFEGNIIYNSVVHTLTVLNSKKLIDVNVIFKKDFMKSMMKLFKDIRKIYIKKQLEAEDID